ncbi:hypothetical protein [Sphaerospermopsis sp. FACHB-1194]|uniref:hypothetical protein n=1 Tax=Sphaerospermopsis sp. FACHB-1194 TaxID=2692862 RepID=UPI001680CDC2|nr:hypothetical protein [Sphaerospermopsis sp. FACHB-1194]MBD2148104.1 hypothetical protein [Sphaerospermopsis sp. FACHB-1194]
MGLRNQKIGGSQITETVTSHQSPVTSPQSPVTSPQSPVTSHQSPVTSHQSPVTSHQSPVTSHQSSHKDFISNTSVQVLPARVIQIKCRIVHGEKKHFLECWNFLNFVNSGTVTNQSYCH